MLTPGSLSLCCPGRRAKGGRNVDHFSGNRTVTALPTRRNQMRATALLLQLWHVTPGACTLLPRNQILPAPKCTGNVRCLVSASAPQGKAML
eukprot:464017-Rhodomonas_salina.1